MGKTVQASTSIPQRSIDPEGIMSVNGWQKITALPELYRQVTGLNTVPIDLVSFSQSYPNFDQLAWGENPDLSATSAIKIVLSFREKAEELKALLAQQQLETVKATLEAIADQGSELAALEIKEQLLSEHPEEQARGYQLLSNYVETMSALMESDHGFERLHLSRISATLLNELGITQRERFLSESSSRGLRYKDIAMSERRAIRTLMLECLRVEAPDKDSLVVRTPFLWDAADKVKDIMQEQGRKHYQAMLGLLTAT